MLRSDHMRLLKCFPKNIAGAGYGEQRSLVNAHHAEVWNDILRTVQNEVFELLRKCGKKGLVVGHAASLPLFLTAVWADKDAGHSLFVIRRRMRGPINMAAARRKSP